MKAMKNLIIISSTHQRANSNIDYATQNKDEGDNWQELNAEQEWCKNSRKYDTIC